MQPTIYVLHSLSEKLLIKALHCIVQPSKKKHYWCHAKKVEWDKN